MRSSLVIFPLFFAATAAQAQMTADFEWLREHQCSAKSPVITVAGIPAGAIKLSASMIDNDMQTFNHGGGSVDIANASEFKIESGALKDYRGPCPPNFYSFGHDYNWTIQAHDSTGSVLATATQTKTFSSKKVPK